MFKPVNRYIEIILPTPPVAQTTSGIVLPDDFKPSEERYEIVTVVSCASDVRFQALAIPASKIVVERSMIEEITVNNEKINVILDNYVVGIINK